MAIFLIGLSPLLHAQTEAAPSCKWSAGLRISNLRFSSQHQKDESYNFRTKSFTESSGIIAQYRPSDKMFWRFGILTTVSSMSQKIVDSRINRPLSDRNSQLIGLGTLVSIGHTFAPAKHRLLRRFRLSTGLNLLTNATVHVYHNSIGYAYGQNGEVFEFEGSSYDVRERNLALNAFGLLEIQITPRLHLGLEFYYGFAAVKSIRQEVGPIEAEPSIYKAIHSTNGMNNPTFTITKSF